MITGSPHSALTRANRATVSCGTASIVCYERCIFSLFFFLADLSSRAPNTQQYLGALVRVLLNKSVTPRLTIVIMGQGSNT